MNEITLIQNEQRYVERVRARQERQGLRPPLSGMPGLQEWRDQILTACICDDSDVCPIHAPHGRASDGSVLLDPAAEDEYAAERET